MEERLNCFLQAHSLKLVNKISKGFSAEVFEVRNENGKRFALKIEKNKSPRKEMAQKEARFLQKANSVGVGPPLIGFDLENRAILMELIDGIPFGKWVLKESVSKKQLRGIIGSLLLQAQKLDSIGLDHGQLAGKGRNILVQSDSKPVIIDFEKASDKRRVHNRTQLESFLFRNPHSAISVRVRDLLDWRETNK